MGNRFQKIRACFKGSLVLVLFSVFLCGNGARAEFSTQAIYGNDDRHEPFEVSPAIQDIVHSVAGMVQKSVLTSNGGGVKLSGITLGKRFCESNRFSEQILGPRCTGFLVSDDLLITAGHCVNDKSECTDYSWIFDYSLKSAGDSSYTTISSDRVYQCREVVARKFNFFTDIDYTIIRLDRKVTGRAPLAVDLVSGLQEGLAIYALGHPSGLPMKVADSSTILNNQSSTLFETELDTFKGNSGSPVFDATTNHVIGVISEGHADWTGDGKCKTPIVCSADRPCNRVKVSRALNFKDDLEKALGH